MTNRDFSKLKRFTQALGDDIASHRSRVIGETGKDISLDIDKIAHNKLVHYLSSISTYPILSEEGDEQVDFLNEESYLWIVDPLDGSLNCNRSIPLYCISISLWMTNEPLHGIIYDIEHGEFYQTIPNSDLKKSAITLNGKPIGVSKTSGKQDGILCIGFPSWRSYGSQELLDFVRKVQEWKKVRLIGSAALSLAWVACGRVDAYIEEDIRIWDVAAGLALVKAAGGQIYCKPGSRKNFVTAAATNGKIPIEQIIS